MDINQFKREAHNLVDWMFEYHTNLKKYPIKSKVKPAYLLKSEYIFSFENIFLPFIAKNHFLKPS